MVYKTSNSVPNNVLCNRLDVLSDAITKGKKGIEREFYMSIPARCDHDADLVISTASRRIKEFEDYGQHGWFIFIGDSVNSYRLIYNDAVVKKEKLEANGFCDVEIKEAWAKNLK